MNLTREEKHEAIMKMKMTMKLEELCEGVPEEFLKYFMMVKRLGFEETPDYDGMKELFVTL